MTKTAYQNRDEETMFTLNNPVKTEPLLAYKVQSNVCAGCGESITILITPESMEAYNQGGYVQDVLSGFAPDIRERFVSGICGECWKTLFGNEEEN